LVGKRPKTLKKGFRKKQKEEKGTTDLKKRRGRNRRGGTRKTNPARGYPVNRENPEETFNGNS